jgi:hypothetical protein
MGDINKAPKKKHVGTLNIVIVDWSLGRPDPKIRPASDGH